MTSKRKNQPGQPFSNKAKKRLAGLILNKTVDIKGYVKLLIEYISFLSYLISAQIVISSPNFYTKP